MSNEHTPSETRPWHTPCNGQQDTPHRTVWCGDTSHGTATPPTPLNKCAKSDMNRTRDKMQQTRNTPRAHDIPINTECKRHAAHNEAGTHERRHHAARTTSTQHTALIQHAVCITQQPRRTPHTATTQQTRNTPRAVAAQHTGNTPRTTDTQINGHTRHQTSHTAHINTHLSTRDDHITHNRGIAAA